MGAVEDDPAELADLRRRAYGPGGGLDGADLARLVLLEDRVRARNGPAEADVAPAASPAPAPDVALPEPPPASMADAQRSAPRVEPGRRTWAWAAAAAAIGVGAVAVAASLGASGSVPDAVSTPTPTPTPISYEVDSRFPPSVQEGQNAASPYPFAADPLYPDYVGRVSDDGRKSLVLLRVPLDGSFGDYVDVAIADDTPSFPAPGGLRWSEPLGRYFGWDLWIARARNGNACLAVTRDELTQAVCAPEEIQADGAVSVDVLYERIPEVRRPDGMTADQSIGFWWLGGSAVAIVLTDSH